MVPVAVQERIETDRTTQDRLLALHTNEELLSEAQKALAEIVRGVSPTPRERLVRK